MLPRGAEKFLFDALIVAIYDTLVTHPLDGLNRPSK